MKRKYSPYHAHRIKIEDPHTTRNRYQKHITPHNLTSPCITKGQYSNNVVLLFISEEAWYKCFPAYNLLRVAFTTTVKYIPFNQKKSVLIVLKPFLYKNSINFAYIKIITFQIASETQTPIKPLEVNLNNEIRDLITNFQNTYFTPLIKHN